MNTIRIYLVRHGETEWNTKGLLQGHLDSPLTQNGIEQAKLLAKRLKTFNLEAIYSSDLERARRTAMIIGEEAGLSVVPVPEFRERNGGIFEGKTWDDVKLEYPEHYEARLHPTPDYAPPGGESYNELIDRILRGVAFVAANHQNGNVVVVTHGGVIHILLKHILGIPFEAPRKFMLHNASINTVVLSGSDMMVETFGDICHLNTEYRDDIES